MSKLHDQFSCEAPICVNALESKDCIWYPGEKVCHQSPYIQAQKVQSRLNRLLAKGKLKHPFSYYTYKMLSTRTSTAGGTRGILPDEQADYALWSR